MAARTPALSTAGMLVVATQRASSNRDAGPQSSLMGEGLGDTGPPSKREAHPILAACLASMILLLATYALASADRQTDSPDAWFSISVYDFTSQEHPTAFEAQPWFWSSGIIFLGWHLLGLCCLLDNTSYADQAFMSALRPSGADGDNVSLLQWPAWYWPSSLTALIFWIVGFGLLVCHRDALIACVVVLNIGSLFAWHHLLHVYRDGTEAPSVITYSLYIVSFAVLAVWMETAAGFLLSAAWARHSPHALDVNSSSAFLVWIAFKVSLLTAGVAALYASVELALAYVAVFVLTLASYLESAPAVATRLAPRATDAAGVLFVVGVGLNTVVAAWSFWRRACEFRGGYLESFNNVRSRVVVHPLTWARNLMQFNANTEASVRISSRASARQDWGPAIRAGPGTATFAADHLSAPAGLRPGKQAAATLVPSFGLGGSTKKQT